MSLPKAADLAQNRPLWRMMSTYGAILELHARNDDDDLFPGWLAQKVILTSVSSGTLNPTVSYHTTAIYGKYM